jgi:hypothetical protein
VASSCLLAHEGGAPAVLDHNGRAPRDQSSTAAARRASSYAPSSLGCSGRSLRVKGCRSATLRVLWRGRATGGLPPLVEALLLGDLLDYLTRLNVVSSAGDVRLGDDADELFAFDDWQPTDALLR